MNSEEKIDKIYETVLKLEPMVNNHDKDLYGNGSQTNPGLKGRVQSIEQSQRDCPARIAATIAGRKLTIAIVALIISVVSCLSVLVLGVLNYLNI